MSIEPSGELEAMHAITSRSYDIGHYIPAIPNHEGSWREGHERYTAFLRIGIDEVELSPTNRKTIEDAFAFMNASLDCLVYQKGVALIHNDLHPKNIVVHGGALSAVIDWVCSQFGEPDFDFSHMIHWCFFPPDTDADLRPFTAALPWAKYHPRRQSRGSFRYTMKRIRLLPEPIPELQSLRHEGPREAGQALSADRLTDLPSVRGNSLEIIAALTRGSV